MEIRLIAADMDGTLLDDEKKIPEENLRVFREYAAFPVLAQQSMRELTLTHRTMDDVIDTATFAVFRDGYRCGFGVDGDHLKTLEEVQQ